MSAISPYLANALGNHAFRNVSFSSPGTSLYFSLHDGDPGGTGLNEISGGSYQRKQFTDFAAPANRAIVSASNLSFDTLTTDLGVASYLGIFDAATSGNFLWQSSVISLNLSSGSSPTFESGNVIISIVGNTSTYLSHKLLNHTFRNTAFTSPGTSLYVSVHNGSFGLTGLSEISGNNYGRVQCTSWSAFSGGQSRNSAIIQFNTPSANWGILSDFGIFDASSSGNALAGGSLSAPYEANSGDSGISFGVSAFTILIS